MIRSLAPMNLQTVSSILFSTDAFWANMKLEGLGMIMSTCSEFRNDLIRTSNKPFTQNKELVATQSSFLSKVIASIMEGDLSRKVKELSLKEAMARFVLPMPLILKFCRALPDSSPYHIANDARGTRSAAFKERTRILFTDAFGLAMNRKGGLQTVAKLKDEAAAANTLALEKTIDSSRRYLAEVELSLERMLKGVDYAMDQLKKEQHKVSIGRNSVLKAMRHAVNRVQDKADFLRCTLNASPASKQFAIKEATKVLKHHKEILDCRYMSNRRLNSALI